MNVQECVDNYIKDYCENCKNKNTDLCEIRVSTITGEMKAKCVDYEAEKQKEG